MSKLEHEIFEIQANMLKKVLGKNIMMDEKGYLPTIDDNLFERMMTPHDMEYKKGSGNELEGKMRSVRSSSAMTFNLLGNRSIQIVDGACFKAGEYSIEYEKQFRTLKVSGKPANLDAYLHCAQDSDRAENIFCEMKMTEWMSNTSNSYPGRLKLAYTKAENYYDLDSADVFIRLIERLKKEEDGTYITSGFSQYDAWQMLKHTIAVFNGLKAKKSADMGKAENATLANIIWEPDASYFDDQREIYGHKLETEHNESEEFVNVMMDNTYGLKQLFEKKCNVDFNMKCITVNEFVDCLADAKRKDYLKRYTLR